MRPTVVILGGVEGSLSKDPEKIRKNMRGVINTNLIFRFVGPYSEITVWSPKDKRITSAGRCVHTQDDVIQEAGMRYQMYVLYPQQLEVYSACHHKHVYLTGPPGCGKTLLMILKAAKWMSEGR